MNKETIYQNIRSGGGRMTKIRRQIVQMLSEKDCLMSPSDILARLKKANIQPHRSTLFRELIFLVKNNIAIKNTISGADYYELPRDHHHHLVCLNCRAIAKVELGNHLAKQEKKLAEENNFNITNHSLDFYGYCRKCQK